MRLDCLRIASRKRYQIVTQIGVVLVLQNGGGCAILAPMAHKESIRKGLEMINIGDKVKAKAINNETFIGTVIALDQQGFAYVNFNSISEARIFIQELEKVEI